MPLLWGDVNCRVGSLESKAIKDCGHFTVNCRVGSLEINKTLLEDNFEVNCRVGSLESLG